jgi:hypothetical protein
MHRNMGSIVRRSTNIARSYERSRALLYAGVTTDCLGIVIIINYRFTWSVAYRPECHTVSVDDRGAVRWIGKHNRRAFAGYERTAAVYVYLSTPTVNAYDMFNIRNGCFLTRRKACAHALIVRVSSALQYNVCWRSRQRQKRRQGGK